MKEYSAKTNYVGDKAKQYYEVRKNQKNWQQEQKIVQEITNKYFSRNQSIIDVPFGTGRFANYYQRKGLKIYAIDISKDMLEEAKKLVNNSSIKYMVGDAENLPFKDNEIDNIICVRLMNWIPIDILENFLKEFKRVAKNKVIVQIHVKTKRGIIKRFFQSFNNNPIKVLKSIFRTVKKKKSSKKKQVHTATYKVHDEHEILDLFSKYNLRIEKEYTVKEYVSWIVQPVKFYVLSTSSRSG